MPTPGPWQGPVQMSSVPGAIFNGGFFRWGRDSPQEVLPGVHTAPEVDAIINGLRAATNGGTEALDSHVTEPLGSACFARCVYDLPTDGTFKDTGDAKDYGWWLSCNLIVGWSDFIAYVQTQQFTAGAAGYEIEGGPSLHIISVDAAQVMIPMDLTANGFPTVSIEVDIATAPGDDYTAIGAEHLWEHRALTTGYPRGTSGGISSEDPINLALEPGHFDASNGGFHLYSRSSQGSGEWDTGGGYEFGEDVGPSIWFHSSFDAAFEVTYVVTYPRYRLLFDGVLPPVPVVAESVTRQFPRDDALGSMGSAPRLVPAPRGGRVVGGYQ